MFEQIFIVPASSRRDRKIALALLMQTIGIAGLALVPMLSVERIAVGTRFTILPPISPPMKPASAPQQREAVSPAPVKGAVRYAHVEGLASRSIPIFHLLSAEVPAAPEVSGAVETGAADGVLGSLGAIGSPHAPLEIRSAARTRVDHGPLHVTSSLSQSHLIFGPKPPYPRLAASARIEGTVRLQATISRDGRIENLHALSGHPLLIRAAMEAVQQWRYQPVLLNGDAVEVITEIDVNFTLQN